MHYFSATKNKYPQEIAERGALAQFGRYFAISLPNPEGIGGALNGFVDLFGQGGLDSGSRGRVLNHPSYPRPDVLCGDRTVSAKPQCPLFNVMVTYRRCRSVGRSANNVVSDITPACSTAAWL